MKELHDFIGILVSKGIVLSVEEEQLNCYADEGVITPKIQDEIVRYKPQLIALLGGKNDHLNDDQYSLNTSFPLSIGAQGLYLVQQLDPDMTAYNVPLCFQFDHTPDIEALQKAWLAVLEKHSLLYTKIEDIDGKIFYVYDSNLKASIDLFQHQNLSLDEKLVLLKGEIRQPFNMNNGPLYRVALHQFGDNENIVLIVVHHVIIDGISSLILLNSLFEFYQAIKSGKTIQPPQKTQGYQQFVEWEQNLLVSAEGRTYQQYWLEQLSGELPVFSLLPDQKSTGKTKVEVNVLGFKLPDHLFNLMKQFSADHSTQPSVLLLSAFHALLSHYTGQHEIIYGMPVQGRTEQKFREEFGYFVNVIPLRLASDSDDSVFDFMKKVQAVMIDGLYHSSYPLPSIIKDLNLNRANNAPLFRVSFVFQNFIDQAGFSNELQDAVGAKPVDGMVQEGEFELELETLEYEGQYDVNFKFNKNSFTENYIHQMFEGFCLLLENFCDTPEKLIHQYDYLSKREKSQLLVEFNDTQSEFPKDKCLHQLFESQALKTPDADAVIYEGKQVSYAELEHTSRQLALYLQALGIGADDVIGVCLDRSHLMVSTLLGVLRSGGAYAPLDPHYPEQRLSYIVKHSAAQVVLTESRYMETLKLLIDENTHLIALDEEWPALSALIEPDKILQPNVKPEHLAYVIYTSGSTGQPKGVAVEHSAIVNRLNWMQKEYHLCAEDRILQKTPYSFDVSVWEFFLPLICGASIVVSKPEGHKDPAYIVDLITKTEVTTLHFVPPMLFSLLNEADWSLCTSVRQVFCSGEELGIELVKAFFATGTKAKLHNLYGPTEAAVDVSYFDCSMLEKHSTVPIGRPIENTQFYVLDKQQNLVPIGVPGELHLAGEGLARGYLHRPDLTEEKFVANPFEPGSRMYKSGDLARWLPDGNVEYLGRIDTQVKIRGFRIEMGEIESSLDSHQEVLASVVVAQGEGNSKSLIAFYVARQSIDESLYEISREDLLDHIQLTLPKYMVPSGFISLSTIPLTTSGKVDRKALESREVELTSELGYLAARNDTEKSLVDIWSDVLEMDSDKIGVHDSFFDLGGNSLLAVNLMSRINDTLNVSFPLSILFKAANIADLSEMVGSKIDFTFDILVPLQSKGSKTPIFGVPGVGGSILSLQPMSSALGINQPFYGLQTVGLDGKQDVLDSIEKIATANIEKILTVQKEGPFRLIGHSFGGVVAYEMARILRDKGKEVSSLVLIDSIGPYLMQVKRKANETNLLCELCSVVADLFDVGLNLEPDYLDKLEWPKRVTFVMDKMKEHNLEMDKDQFEILFNIYKVNQDSYYAYKPKSKLKDVEICLFSAVNVERTMPEDFGWNDLVEKPVKVYPIYGDHFSIMEKGNVMQIAEQLNLFES
jgi:polyketide synthase PksN